MASKLKRWEAASYTRRLALGDRGPLFSARVQPAASDYHMTTSPTREGLKSAARKLFAERGFDGVTVRDIIQAAGQRNGASLYYHFRTKEALVLELVVDGAKLIDDRRNALLNVAAERGGPTSLREVVEMLVYPSTALEANAKEDGYIRFITMLQMTHRDLFMRALAGRWNSGYTRCLAHVRSFLPNLDANILRQRLVFTSLYLNAVMSQRETALQGGRHLFWSAPNVLENYIDTIVGLLTQPCHSADRTVGAGKHHRSRSARGRGANPARTALTKPIAKS